MIFSILRTVTIKSHTLNDIQIAEILSGDIIINNAEDGLDLLGNLYYQGFDAMILHEKNITPEFFDLKNGMAGEILQKFSNYRMRLAIVGDFTKYSGKSIRDFMNESNQGRHIGFLNSTHEALERMAHP